MSCPGESPVGVSVQYAGAAQYAMLRILEIDLDPVPVFETQRSVIENPANHRGARLVAMRREALLMIQCGDVESARWRYESLRPIVKFALFDGLETGDRSLGYLARKIGELEQAAEHYRDALDFCRGGGFRVELAWSLSEYAEVLLERDAPGDRERATEHQDEAIDIAQELGMRPLLERVLAQREMLEA